MWWPVDTGYAAERLQKAADVTRLMSNTIAPPALMPHVKSDGDNGVYNAGPDAHRGSNARRPAHKRHVSGFSLTDGHGDAANLDTLHLAAPGDPNQLKRTKSMGVDDLEAELRGSDTGNANAADPDNDPSLDDIDNLSQRLASRRVSISSTPGDNDISQLIGFAVGPTSTSASVAAAAAAPPSPPWASSSSSSSGIGQHENLFQAPGGPERNSVLGRRENPMASMNDSTNKISRKNMEENGRADVSSFNARASESQGNSSNAAALRHNHHNINKPASGSMNTEINHGHHASAQLDSKNGEDDDDDDDDDEDGDDDMDAMINRMDTGQGSANDSTEMDGWLLDDDSQLKQLVEKFGKEWASISERISKRTENECKDRWDQLTKAPFKKGTWTSEEDARLRRLIENVEKRNWGEVASLIPGRSAKQCRERWCYNLDPTINKTPWKPEEDSVLMKSQLELGNKWAKIASMLPGRTENAVKTRFKSIMRAKKREWMPEEDETIMRLHQQLGSRWDAIAEKLPNRSKNAIKTRYRALSKGITSQLPQTGAPNQILRRPEFRAAMASAAASSSSPSSSSSAAPPPVPSFPQFGQGTGGDGLRKSFASAPPHNASGSHGHGFNGVHSNSSSGNNNNKVRPGSGFAAPGAPPPKVVSAASNHKPRSMKMNPKVQRDPQTDILNGIHNRHGSSNDFASHAHLDAATALDLFAGKSASNALPYSNTSSSSSGQHGHDHHNPILGNFSDSHNSFEDLASGLTQSKLQQGRRSSSFTWSHASGSHQDLFGLHHSDSRGQLSGPGFGSGSGAMQGLDRAGVSGAGFRTVQEVEETFMNDDEVPLQDDELVDFLNIISTTSIIRVLIRRSTTTNNITITRLTAMVIIITTHNNLIRITTITSIIISISRRGKVRARASKLIPMPTSLHGSTC
ncbi:Myb protein, partial [Hondaea fermentalgiana]